jgi:hypothetical protein
MRSARWKPTIANNGPDKSANRLTLCFDGSGSCRRSAIERTDVDTIASLSEQYPTRIDADVSESRWTANASECVFFETQTHYAIERSVNPKTNHDTVDRFVDADRQFALRLVEAMSNPVERPKTREPLDQRAAELNALRAALATFALQLDALDAHLNVIAAKKT